MSSDGTSLPSLTAHDLACQRGDRLLFKGLNLRLDSGRGLWLRGRNGRGKTSLLRLAAGLGAAAHGELRWGGEPVRRSEAFARQRVWIGHQNALKEDLTATESLQFLARLHGRRHDPASVQAALAAAGVADRARAPVRTLSQGQRRRVALARLVLEDAPGLWLLDEPYDALDVDGVRWLGGVLRGHLARGGSLMFASHLPAEAEGPEVETLDLDPSA